MKMIEILKEQVKELSRLLELKDKRIQELEFLVSQNKTITIFNTPNIIGCSHDYPSPWLSTTPPTCKKCGLQATNYITLSTNTSASGGGAR